MNSVPMHGDLQIDQDLRFSQREWRTQKAGWLVMLLLILAALLGVFGRGPLSPQQAVTANGRLILAYDRVARHSATDVLRLAIAPTAVSGDTVSIWFDRAYMHARAIESISPEPQGFSSSGDRIVYRFRVDDPARPAVIAFLTNPRDIGRRRGSAGIVGGDSLRFAQFILP